LLKSFGVIIQFLNITLTGILFIMIMVLF